MNTLLKQSVLTIVTWIMEKYSCYKGAYPPYQSYIQYFILGVIYQVTLLEGY